MTQPSNRFDGRSWRVLWAVAWPGLAAGALVVLGLRVAMHWVR